MTSRFNLYSYISVGKQHLLMNSTPLTGTTFAQPSAIRPSLSSFLPLCSRIIPPYVHVNKDLVYPSHYSSQLYPHLFPQIILSFLPLPNGSTGLTIGMWFTYLLKFFLHIHINCCGFWPFAGQKNNFQHSYPFFHYKQPKTSFKNLWNNPFGF